MSIQALDFLLDRQYQLRDKNGAPRRLICLYAIGVIRLMINLRNSPIDVNILAAKKTHAKSLKSATIRYSFGVR